jgi:hypothetical protein
MKALMRPDQQPIEETDKCPQAQSDEDRDRQGGMGRHLRGGHGDGGPYRPDGQVEPTRHHHHEHPARDDADQGVLLEDVRQVRRRTERGRRRHEHDHDDHERRPNAVAPKVDPGVAAGADHTGE